MNPRILFTIVFTVVSISLFGQITLTTNKATSRYNIGEQINFVAKSSQSGNATYTIRYDGNSVIQTGSVFLQAGVSKNIPYTSFEANLITCIIDQNGQGNSATAAVSPYQIQPLESIPNNFDSFWAGQKAKLTSIPLGTNIFLHSTTTYSKTYRIRLSQIDNRKVYGYVTVPNGNGNYPAFLVMPSFGQAAGTIEPEVSLAERSNCITISISIHNADVDQEDPNAYEPDDYINPDQNYFRYAILAGVRAIDYLHSRGDVNKSRIGVYGVSQGGGLAILMAGIDDRISVCINTISILCEHAGFKYGRATGFPYYLRNAPGNDYPQAQTLDAVKYYDAVHAANRFKGSVLMNISYLDDVTPAATEFAAFNQFTGDHKLLVHSTRLGHISPSRLWEDRFRFLRRVWPTATANPVWPYGDTTSKGHFVDAGNDKSAQAGTAINLTGTVRYNDGVNFNWPVNWEKVSGPGAVNFSNTNNRNTSATFSTNGTYVLRFRAEDQQTYSSENIFMAMEDFITVNVSGNTTTLQNQSISFSNISNKLVNDNSFNISATASSGLQVSFGIVSGPASISGNTITLTGQAGVVTVRANQSGNTTYYPATEVRRTFQVSNPTDNGNDDCSSLSLLSQGKPASSSSTLNVSGVSGGPEKAVDGNTNGSYWNGSVSANTESYQPWWQVDLGAVQTIEQIKIWNRTEGTSRLDNFRVMVSDTPLSNNLNTAISSSNWNQNTSGSAGSPSTFNLAATGRYVRVQANGNSYLTIAEVQVYGCADNSSGGGVDNSGSADCDDFDNDGVCNEDDCNIWNASLPATPGTPCNDYDPHNFNDVYLADGCTCQGSDGSNGGSDNSGGNTNCDDFDNDGVCNEDDCNIWNPNLPATPGTPCNDYDPHNFNDVYLADGCTCQGSDGNNGGSDNSGGNTNCDDFDNDGVCNEDDCNIWNPNLPATPGTPCNDYDPHNFNDVYLADGCTCQGSDNSNGGNDATDVCDSRGISTAYEYIERVQIGSINNISGNNSGLGNYENQSTTVSPGSVSFIRLTPGFTGSSDFVYWRIWIDFNQDGDYYDAGEYFFQEKSNTVVSSNVSFPSDALSGTTKMRISMKAGSFADPCETFPYGEVENYTINFTGNNTPFIGRIVETIKPFDFTMRPNPVDDFVVSEFINKKLGAEINQLQLYNALGEKINIEQLDYRIEEDRLILFTSSLENGYYLLSISCDNEFVTKPFVKIR